MAQTTLPGVKVGPLDPDATENFGQVSGRTSARQLIRTHAAAHPPDLIRALSLPRDDERSEVLSLTEIEEALTDEELPEGAVLTGAAVRGARDRQQVLTFSYRVESGRVVKWYTDYDGDRFPISAERGDAAVRIAELRKTGMPLTGEGSDTDLHIGAARAQAAEREAAGLRSEVEELRKRLEEAGAQGGGKTAEQERQEEEGAATDASGAEEPVEGYSELKADDARKLIREADKPTTEAVLAYEREVGKRSTVISQAEQRLDHLANDQGDGSGD